jgi:hypothetical protein
MGRLPPSPPVWWVNRKEIEMKAVNSRNGERFDIYIGRPSKWGNPFSVEKYGRIECIRLYKQALWRKMKDPAYRAMMLRELDGKTLQCFCAPLPCHGDVLIAAIEWLKDDGKIK